MPCLLLSLEWPRFNPVRNNWVKYLKCGQTNQNSSIYWVFYENVLLYLAIYLLHPDGSNMLFIIEDSALASRFTNPTYVYYDYANHLKNPNTTHKLITVRQLNGLVKARLNAAVYFPTTKIYTEVE